MLFNNQPKGKKIRSNYNANIVVHIDESLSANQLHDAEKDLTDVADVVSSCVHERTRHLLFVDYDSRTIQSGILLAHL